MFSVPRKLAADEVKRPAVKGGVTSTSVASANTFSDERASGRGSVKRADHAMLLVELLV